MNITTSPGAINALSMAPNKIREIGTNATGLTVNGDLTIQGRLHMDEYRGLRFAVRDIANGFIVQHARTLGEHFKEYYCEDLKSVGGRVAACCAEETLR